MVNNTEPRIYFSASRLYQWVHSLWNFHFNGLLEDKITKDEGKEKRLRDTKHIYGKVIEKLYEARKDL